MLKLQERIDLFQELGNYIKNGGDEQLESAIHLAYMQNSWFTPENSWKSLHALADTMLNQTTLETVAKHYNLPELQSSIKTVGLVMAGNIPLVGFHDWLCVILSGHHARVKLSDKDKVLLPFLIQKMAEWRPEIRTSTYFLREDERLGGFDTVIATGSNNTARYFEQYFAKYPNIIRKNRTSVAVLTGKETQEELSGLSNDLLAYFGLGCRNVSKLYVPVGFNFMPLLETCFEHKSVIQNDKYKNNYDYSLTLYLLNKIDHHTSGNLLFREDESYFARISTVHFSYYSDLEEVNGALLLREEELQCVVANEKTELQGLKTVGFGQAQCPGFMDYADGVDVMEFLIA